MPALWKRCPRTAILNGHLDKGWGFIDDFLSLGYDPTDSDEAIPNWTYHQQDSGTVTILDYQGGWLQLDSGGTTADDGVTAYRGTANGGECFVPAVGAEIFFEARVYPVDLGSMEASDGMQLFIGLADRTTPIMASGVVDATDYVGFKYDANDTDGDWHFVGYDGTEDDNDTGVDIDDGSTVKLGFWIKETDKMVPYINGVALEGHKITASASIPGANMMPILGCFSEGGVDPILKVDYVACFQKQLLDDPISS